MMRGQTRRMRSSRHALPAPGAPLRCALADSAESLPRMPDRNTQRIGQRFCGATPMTRLSCAPRNSPPQALPTTASCPAPTARARRSRRAVASHGSRPAASPFKTHTPRNADPQPRSVPCSSIPARSTPRNTPEHFKKISRTVGRCAARKTPFFSPSPKIFCVERAPDADYSPAVMTTPLI